MTDIEGAIGRNLAAVRERIADACARVSRDPDEVTFVAVTKYVGVEEITALRELGVTHMGENRLGQAQPKIESVDGDIQWHMVGNLQRRKVRDSVTIFDYIDAVDRIELAEEIDKRSGAIDKVMPILLEVNVSGEEQKHGFAPAELAEALELIVPMRHLDLRGLMTMAPHTDDVEKTRPIFRRLAELARDNELETVSMGMTNDFDLAIEEGATEVRIGSALFEGLLKEST